MTYEVMVQDLRKTLVQYLEAELDRCPRFNFRDTGKDIYDFDDPEEYSLILGVEKRGRDYQVEYPHGYGMLLGFSVELLARIADRVSYINLLPVK